VDSGEKCSEGIEQSKALAVVEIVDVGQTLGDQSLTKCSTTALSSVAERTTSTISPKATPPPPPVQKRLTETRQATAGTSGGSTRVADYDEEDMRLRAQMKAAALEQGSDSDEEDEEVPGGFRRDALPARDIYLSFSCLFQDN
jgi:hypothetical protein